MSKTPRGKHGGVRPGAGRKPGALSLTSRETALKATEAVGLTPIEVMAKNLLFWDTLAEDLTEKLREITINFDGDNDEVKQAVNALIKAIDRMVTARERAQQCAVDMAPYRHPRLASITLEGNPDKPVEHVHKGMTPREAAEAYAATLSSNGPAS